MNYSHFVGLDVGKKTFDASLMSADEKELSHKSFDNTPTGIQSLLDWIAGYHLSLSKLLFCAENMGSYVTELSVCSVSMGFSLALVCPLTIKKSIGLQRGKNDRIDAKRIANYAVLHYRKLELYKLPDKDLVRLRGWIIIRDNLVKQKVLSIKSLETFSQMAKFAACGGKTQSVCNQCCKSQYHSNVFFRDTKVNSIRSIGRIIKSS